MPLTLGLTGMDSATETVLKTAFEKANASLGNRFTLADESDAKYVIVDMDSMYGPMSWLRLHGADKVVIGLTSAPRTQADFRLARPFDADAVTSLLRDVADKADVSLAPTAPAPIAAEPVVAAPPRTPDSTPERVPAPSPTRPPPPAKNRTLSDWLSPGVLVGRVRYVQAGCPDLLIDAGARQYHGPATLKPLQACFECAVERDAFVPVNEAGWKAATAKLGAAQPLTRLQWYGALVAGHGSTDLGITRRYRLGKWPQTEREFPKHFRIATVMMKGPATIDEIATASSLSKAEVADFINANLMTGYAEPVSDTPPESSEPAKPSGILGRLRGR